MEMSSDEIVRRYQHSPTKQQIGILAQLNACSRSIIIGILEEKGAYMKEDDDKVRPARRHAGTEKAKKEKVVDPEMKKMEIPEAVIIACTDRVDKLAERRKAIEEELKTLRDEEQQLIEFLDEVKKWK